MSRYAPAYGEPMLSSFRERDIIVRDGIDWECDVYAFDYVWVNSQVLPAGMGTQLLHLSSADTPTFIFNHMSCLPYAPDEHPYVHDLETRVSSLSVFVSEEARDTLLPFYSTNVPMTVMPNPAPSSFIMTKDKVDGIKNVLFVTNHSCEEIIEAHHVLESKGVRCHLIGIDGEYRLLTPKDIRAADAVVTIGKTVQYCLVSGTPVYVYDHFGGYGYMTDETYEDARYSNFSGRGGIRMTGDEMASEILAGFSDQQEWLSRHQEEFRYAFSMEEQARRVFLMAERVRRSSLDLDEAYVLSLESTELFARRYYCSWRDNNHLRTDLRDAIIERDEKCGVLEALREREERTIRELVSEREACDRLRQELETERHRYEASWNSRTFRLGRAIAFPAHTVKEHFHR